MMQYVYLIRSQNFYKIGVANDVESRLSQLQTGNPILLELVACYSFTDATAVERVMHQKFSACRSVGEWFSLGTEQVAAFREICMLLDGVPPIDMPFTANEEAIEDAEEIQTTQDILIRGLDWRLEPRNERGYAIFKRGGVKVYLGYVGKLQMKDWEHPTVEEVEAAIARYKTGDLVAVSDEPF